MLSMMGIDSRIVPYTRNNDPLPDKLKPIVDAYLRKFRAHISTYDVRISEAEKKILDLQCTVESLENETKELKKDRERQRKRREDLSKESRAHISTCDDRIGEAKGKIQLLEKEIEELRAEQGRQQERKNMDSAMISILASTVSVVRRLPPEIIASVVTISTWSDEGEVCQGWLVKLCKVSHLWRDTAISTPTLWRALCVNLDRLLTSPSPEQGKPSLSSALDMWLSRGGSGAGIELTFDGGRHTGHLEDFQTRDLIDWIKTSSFHFVSLTFNVGFPSIANLQSLLYASVPSLHSTKGLTLELPPMLPMRPSINIESTLPNLHQLALRSLHYDDGNLSTFFLHSNLGEIKIFSLSLRETDLLSMLGGLPSLQFVTLDSCWISGIEDEGTIGGDLVQTLTHHAIRKIAISNTLFGHFLTGLTCPALERLDLIEGPYAVEAYADGMDEGSAEEFGRFIKRSRPSSLTVHLDPLFPSFFVSILLSDSTPWVKTLHLASLSFPPFGRSDNDNLMVLPASIQQI
ncbi:hypothetical protein BKA70DRAFT_1279035, partial [Coprinopsis sp. MPI-PUGE-AT-0042]